MNCELNQSRMGDEEMKNKRFGVILFSPFETECGEILHSYIRKNFLQILCVKIFKGIFLSFLGFRFLTEGLKVENGGQSREKYKEGPSVSI